MSYGWLGAGKSSLQGSGGKITPSIRVKKRTPCACHQENSKALLFIMSEVMFESKK